MTHPGPFGYAPLASLASLLVATLTACQARPPGFGPKPSYVNPPGALADRHGEEIMVAGVRVHAATPVVLWTDPGGYDAYRVDRRFVPLDQAGYDAWPTPKPDPQRYGLRTHGLTSDELEAVRGGGWTLDRLRRVVDQVVIHYDACGTSRRAFEVLHDERHLSAHFLIDLDGTIYQTLDVQERAWHAGVANDRSVGIELAQIGAYPPDEAEVLSRWYAADPGGTTRITIPEATDRKSLRTPGFVARPRQPDPITGIVQRRELMQYDFTPEQYHALARLLATLHVALPG
ncbi:MAG: peptidoglycan recognition family protein, partial [Planctomycetota bacterium]